MNIFNPVVFLPILACIGSLTLLVKFINKFY